MDLIRRVTTNFEASTGELGQAPVNQFSHAKAFPPVSFRAVFRPNFDTLYSVAWLDLGREPLVMTLPRTDRYHVFQMMDGWSEVFAAPGTRMTGGRGGSEPDRRPRLAGGGAERHGTPPQPHRHRLGGRPHPDERHRGLRLRPRAPGAGHAGPARPAGQELHAAEGERRSGGGHADAPDDCGGRHGRRGVLHRDDGGAQENPRSFTIRRSSRG